MIQASFFIDQQKVVRSFRFSGHAGYADYGEDIVCAGISAIACTVIGSLQETIAIAPDYQIDEEEGLIACQLRDYESLDSEDQIRAAALMMSAMIGAEQASMKYGDYIKVVKCEYIGRETR